MDNSCINSAYKFPNIINVNVYLSTISYINPIYKLPNIIKLSTHSNVNSCINFLHINFRI